jgi:hypothetical protein
VAWLYANPPDAAYTEIGSFLEKYLQLSICDADCRTATRPLAALAIYKSGDAVLKKSTSYYCDNTVAVFKDLVTRYGDTQGGQMAAAALSAPVTYNAVIDHFPPHATTPAYLSRIARPSNSDNGYFSDEYTALVDSEGVATFQNVPPGTYNFSIVFKGERWYWNGANHSNILSATVTSLCASTQYYGWI